jgi:hypothetical protein
MDKESIFKYYGWRPEDGDYEPKDIAKPEHKLSRIAKLINLLISVFVLHGHSVRRR